MVTALELAGALHGQEVPGVGNHADLAIAALPIATNLTEGFCREVEAALALTHLAAGRQQGIGEGMDLLFRLAQQVQGQPLGGARTNAWQPFKLLDQPG